MIKYYYIYIFCIYDTHGCIYMQHACVVENTLWCLSCNRNVRLKNLGELPCSQDSLLHSLSIVVSITSYLVKLYIYYELCLVRSVSNNNFFCILPTESFAFLYTLSIYCTDQQINRRQFTVATNMLAYCLSNILGVEVNQTTISFCY